MIPSALSILVCIFGLVVSWPAVQVTVAIPRPAGIAEPGRSSPGTFPLTLAIDPARSEIAFTVRRPREVIEGRAHRFSGRVVVDPARPGDGAEVILTIEAASLETGNRMRDRKMHKSHLEVDRFVEIRFRSTGIRLSAKDPEDPGGPLVPGESRKALVEGLLSLHGIDREILFPVTIRYDGGSLTSEGELGFRLSDHDIPIPRFLWMVLDDDVRVRFHLTAMSPADGAATAAPGAADGAEER